MARHFYGRDAWPPYVPVADQRKIAQNQVRILRDLGLQAQPVDIVGNSVATSVWGQAWCRHLGSFHDYANRLPRGRSYVRHGAVIHLELEPGMIRALVHGTETYYVEVGVQPLDPDSWRDICRRCQGQIESLLALLEGKISSDVMAIVAHRKTGLLPRPGEIRLSCSCPDRAVMCKHVAATLFGVGHRLDTEPELLFELRGVDPEGLLFGTVEHGASTQPRDDDLQDEELAVVFGVAVDLGGTEQPLTGEDIKTARARFGETTAEFASRLGVATSTVYQWERTDGTLHMRKKSRQKFDRIVARSSGSR